MLQTFEVRSVVLMLIKVSLLGIFGLMAVNAYAAENRSIQLTESEHDYLHISDSEQQNLDIAGDLTISMWVKPENVTDNMPLISKWNRADKTQYILFLETGELGVHLNDESSGYNYSTHRVSHGKNANEWLHVAMVYRAASGTTELFVDGQSLGIDNSAPHAIADTNADFSIGGREDGVTAFKGKIDDVRIWSRSLSATKIDSIFANPSGFKNGANLQGYWKFNGHLRDQSVNNNDLNFTYSTDVPF